MASPSLDTHDDLLAALRRLGGLTERGKTPGHFYRGSQAYLHFHGQGHTRSADLRRDGAWDRLPAGTPEARAALLATVRTSLAEG
jgi:hypothetical protein